ncbi:gliding motility-associated C-terminal domain-containing protein [Aquimarina sp. Aq107]|uniref:DUF7507 domain-containing protein n=2 Tax=Aquimarina sp. Aq107 TaxID=1191912 RepID=UPI0020B40179|nr:gliding motility-associated C-terminal domain-containing protein [Aquimarina sp. Aq107]
MMYWRRMTKMMQTQELVSVSDVSLTKGVVLTTDADGSTTATAGDTVTFTVTVSNGGSANATGVEVTDQVPTGYTIVGTPTVSQGTYTVGTGVWDVGTINTSGNATLTIIATVNATGTYVNVAEVTASDNFDPDSTPNNDVLAEDDQDDADPGVAPVSDVSLTKGVVLTTDADGSTTATAGDTVTFTVTVSNGGSANATGVEVTDQVPTGYTIVGTPTVSQGTYTVGTGVWDVGTINTSGNATLTIIATVNATGTYVNVAEVTASDNFDPDSTPNNDVLAEDDQDDADPGVAPVSDVSLTKGVVLTTDADGSTTATAGDTVTFTVTVSNGGSANATGVEVTDQVPTGYTIVGTPTVSQGTYTVGTGVWDVGTINTSGNATLTIIATVNATGTYVNVAEVTASDNFDPDSTPNNDVLAEDDQDDADPGVAPVSDVSLTKGVVLTTDADGSTTATAGDTVTFTVTVSNGGSANATGVEVTDQVPTGYTIVGTPTVSQGTYTVGTGVWDVGTINTSGNATLTIIATVNATGTYVNVAEVTASDNFDPDSTPNNDVLAEDDQDDADPGVAPVSDVSLTKGVVLTTDADGSTTATAGDTVTFTVTVSNGGSANATGVEVTDQVPTGYTIVGTPTVSQGTYTVGTGVWDVGTINTSGNATLTIIATVNATGTYVNVAEVTASDNFDPDSTPNNDVLAEDDQDDADPGVAPVSDVSLTKGVVLTTDADGSTTATAGDTVTFTVTVSNGGSANATGVEVTDQVPTGYTIVGTPTVSQGTYTVGTGVWDVGTINTSGNATLTIIATVNATGTYVNVAEVTASDNFDPDSTPNNDVLAEDDQDDADPGVAPVSDVSLTKGVVLTTDADGSTTATAGDTVTFTVTVSNGGSANATGVEVTDQVPTGYTIVGTPTVSQGTYTVGTGVWDVGTINTSGNATLTIIATVNATGTYVNVAEVTASDNFDPDSTPNNDVLAEDDQDDADPGVGLVSDVSLTKGVVLTTDADGSTTATAGDTVTFTVTVSNGGSANATGVEVTDQVPTGYTIVGTPTVSQGTYTVGTGVWDVGTINTSGNATLTIIATVNATGTYVNVAEVTASDNFDPDSTPNNDVLAEDDQDDADPGVAPVSDVSLTKGVVLTTDADGSTTATAGDTVTFTVTVSNGGSANATGVEVTDQVPTGYTIVGTPTVSQGTYTVGTGVWDVGTINTSGNATLTIIATVNATGTYVNVAEVTASDNFDPDSTPNNDVLAEDDQDDADPGVAPVSDVSLTKGVVLTTDADGSTTATAGDTVTFTVTVSNGGSANATGVEVTDQVPTGYTIVGTPTVSQGTYTVGTGVWDVGTINTSGNATLTIIATVNATGTYVNVAEVTASDNFDPDSTPNNDVLAEDDQDDADPGVAPVSDVSLTKGVVLTTDADGSTTATAGDTVTFTVTVSNGGSANATGVEVTDQVPTGYTIVGTPTVSQGTYTVGTGVWDVGTINTSGNATLTIIATVNATGTYVNVAEVTASDNFDPDSTPNNDVLAEDDQDDADPGVGLVSDVSLTKGVVLTTDADGSTTATAGDTVTFTVTVSNGGSANATGVEVTDQVPTGYTIVGTPTVSQGTYTVGTGVWDVGTINTSGNATLTIIATVNATGTYVNVAEVTASDNFDPDSTPNNDVLAEDDQDDADPGVAPVSDVSLTKGVVLTTDADGSTTATAGDTVTFTVTVSNGGSANATGVEVTDQVPTGYTIVGTPTVSQGTYTVGTGVWDVGTINTSGNATLTIIATVNATGTYVNVAEVTASDNFDPDSTPNNDVLAEDDQDDADPGVAPVSDVSLTKGVVLTTDADGSTTATAGDTVTFTVTVSNGGSANATGVEVTDQVPTGYTIVGTPTVSQGTYTVGTGVWDVGTINTSGNATLTIIATVNATGTYVNVAEVTASDNFDPDSTPNNDVLAEDDQDDADPGVAPVSDVSLTKGVVLTTDADGSTTATAGDTVTFTVTVSNGGSANATGVEVTDQVPTGYTIVGTPTVSQGTYTVGTGVWDVGTINTSGNATLTIIATVNATGTYVNVAEVTASDNFDPDSTPNNDVLAEDDQDDADPGVAPVSDVSLTKGVVLTTDADGSTTATAGDTVTFTVTVSNGGSANATGVEVTDQVPTGYTIVGTPTVSQGTYTVGTGVWDVGTINTSGNATLTIIATVNATGTYVNVAEVTASDNFDPDSTPNNDVLAEDDQDDADPGVAPVSDVSLTKGVVLTTDVDGSTTATAGDTVTFTVTVSNGGSANATGVEVTDQVPTGYTIVGTPTVSQGTYTVGTGVWDVGTINTSGNATLTIIATVNATGTYVNVAEVTASDNFDPDSTPNNDVLAEDDQDDADPGVAPVSDVSLTKGVVLTTDADGSTTATAGDTVTFTVTVSNGGSANATGVEVTDQVPTGYTIVGTPTVSQGTYTVGTGVWDVGTINTSGNATLTIIATVNATGTYVNVAEVTASDNFDPDSTPNNDVLAEDDQDDADPGVAPVSDLSIAKSVVLTTDADTDTVISVGDTVTFSVTVTNAGPNNATGVGVGDTVPDGYTTISSISDSGSESGGLISWSGLSINSGMSLVLTYTAVVTATGNYTNFAEITASDNFDLDSSPDATPDTDAPVEDDETSATPDVPNLSVIKTVRVTGSVLNDVIEYDIVVTNTGNVTLTNIEITDDNADAGSIVGSPIVSLAPGVSVTVTANQTITQADIDAGYIENSATATGDSPLGGPDDVSDVSDAGDETVETPDGDGSTDSDPTNDTTVTTFTPSPNLSVIKTVRVAGSVLNDVIEYDIVVTNTGNVTLTDIEITDDNADAGSIVGSPIVSLAPGVSVTVTANQTITQADIDAGYIENSATATGDSPLGGPDDVSDVSDAGDETVETPDGDGSTDSDPTNDTTVTTFTPSPSLSVIKTVRVAGSVLNDVIEYDIVVTNTGNVTLTNIEITDDNADAGSIVGSPIVSLAPGVSVTVTANQTITQADIDAGYIENSATATGDSPLGGPDDVSDVSDAGDETVETPDGDGSTDSDPTNDTTVTTFTPSPNLSVIKTVRVAGSVLNDVIEYDIVVTNTGNVTLTDIEITDDNADAGSIVGSPIVSLAPGVSVTVTANQTITQADIDAGYIENSATATGDSPLGGPDDVSDVSDAGDETVETPDGDGSTDSDPTNDTTVTTFTPSPSLSVIKTVRVAGSVLNDVIEYDIVVTNTGNVTLTNIEITDDNADAGSIVGSPIVSLAPGVSVTVTANQTITQADIDAGYIENSATATGDSPLGGPDDVSDVSDAGDETVETPDGDGSTDSDPTNDTTVTDLSQDPELTLVKTGVASGSNVGDVITYTFTVTNTGDVTIDNIFIDDILTGSTNLAVSPSILAPGEEGIATVEYVITQTDINNGEVINSATVIGDDPDDNDVIDISDNGDETVDDNGDGDPTNDETITDIEQLPNLALTKTGFYVDVNGDDLPNVGDEIQYTFTVENTGNVDVTNIVLTDPLEGIVVTGGPIDLAVGEIDMTTFTATYVLTAEDVLLGEVINQATVTGQDPNGDDVIDLSDDPTDTTDVDLDNDGDAEDETVTIIEGVFTDPDDPIIIYTGITPNGDGINDDFRIVGLRNFPDNTLRIYNRWGVQVFEEDGYEQPGVELFTGISNGRVTISQNNKLPVGTYYYVLEYINARGVNTYKAGYLYINR